MQKGPRVVRSFSDCINPVARLRGNHNDFTGLFPQTPLPFQRRRTTETALTIMALSQQRPGDDHTLNLVGSLVNLGNFRISH